MTHTDIKVASITGKIHKPPIHCSLPSKQKRTTKESITKYMYMYIIWISSHLNVSLWKVWIDVLIYRQFYTTTLINWRTYEGFLGTATVCVHYGIPIILKLAESFKRLVFSNASSWTQTKWGVWHKLSYKLSYSDEN